MTKVDRKSKALILLTVVAVAAILGSIALTVYAADNEEETCSEFPKWINEKMRLGPEIRAWARRWLRGQRQHRFIEVSEEFKENVINIAESDEDVQDLLDDGYNITRVRPIVKSIIEADGDVETKATSAVVMLCKDTTSKAFVWVNVEEGTVTKIVILTRTVIEK